MKPAYKNISIGVVVLFTILLAIRALLFLHPHPGDGKLILNVRFQNIDKLAKGTKVTFAGKPVGEVISISPVVDSRDEEGIRGIYPYQLTLSLDSSVRVYDTDEISVKTAGLMGEKFIAITPMPAPPGKVPALLEQGSLIYASSGLNVEDTMSNFTNIAKKAEKTIDTLADVIQKNQEGLNITLRSLENASVQFDKLLTRINQVDIPGTASRTIDKAEHVMDSIKGVVQQFSSSDIIQNAEKISSHLKSISEAIDQPEQIHALMASLQKTSDEFSSLIASIEKSFSSSSGSVESLTNDIRDSIRKIHDISDKADTIVQKVAKGEGTIGKLLLDDEAYFRTLRVLNRSDLLLSDINNYGLLFHLDNSWQRLRRSRIEEAELLSTPSQVKTYIDEEMQTIFVSFRRLDEALQRAEKNAESPGSLKDPKVRLEFTESFKDLQRNVQDLDDRLKTVSTVLGAENEGPSS